MWEVKTRSVRSGVRPDRPVTCPANREVLIDDAAHPEMIQRSFEGHSMDVTGSERCHMASDLAGNVILHLIARFERVVLRDENLTVGHAAAVRLQDLVLEDIRIVIEIVRWKWSRDLDEFGRDFRSS